MISFRVDGRSVVPPYLQIVQQARQALRMGLLDVGDKLPAVREVVAATAVNPNTVLKAYRDLEREGLIEARPGHGTFVLKRPPGPPPAAPRPSLAVCASPARRFPLPGGSPPGDHTGLAAPLTRRWDAASARDRLRSLNIPLDRAAGSLSGGQRAQLALALTLAKKPGLLLLDEPVAALDPLARRHFLATLAEAVAGGGLTVLRSSPLLAHLERGPPPLI